jgi:putative peptidoglycan lipid II flippase
LYYADRVYQINLAIAGIAVGTVSLPVLSKAIGKKNIKKISTIQNKAFELSLLLSIPASLGLVLASEEIVSALFGYGSFTEENISMTALALKYFGYGVPAFSLIKVLPNFFFARHDTKTPFFISFFIVLLNITISLSFFKEIGFVIIAISTSISTWVGVLIYTIILEKNKFLLIQKTFIRSIAKITTAGILMSILLFYGIEIFSENLSYYNKFKSIYLLFIVSFVATIYLITCYLLGVLKIKNYKIK